MNKQKLQSAILAFVKNKNDNAAYNSDNWAERRDCKTAGPIEGVPLIDHILFNRGKHYSFIENGML